MTIALAGAFMIAMTVAANLLLKLGTSIESTAPWPWRLLNLHVAGGLCAYGLAGLSYATLLQWLPLNVAQTFASAQFVAVILASAFILAEPIPMVRWVGFALIGVGIVLIGLSST